MKLESELLLARSWAEEDAIESRPGYIGIAASPLASALQHLIDDLREQVALVDESFTIVAVNRAWTEAMASYGYYRLAPGDNYRAACERHAIDGFEPATRAIDALD